MHKKDILPKPNHNYCSAAWYFLSCLFWLITMLCFIYFVYYIFREENNKMSFISHVDLGFHSAHYYPSWVAINKGNRRTIWKSFVHSFLTIHMSHMHIFMGIYVGFFIFFIFYFKQRNWFDFVSQTMRENNSIWSCKCIHAIWETGKALLAYSKNVRCFFLLALPI